MAQQLTGI